MKEKFKLATQIQFWIDNKQLVQIHNSERTADFDVAYILHFENNFLTFTDIGTDGKYGGIIMCHIDDVQLFKTESLYLQELVKKVDNDSIYQQAKEDIDGIDKFTPSGLLSTFKGEKTIVGITYSSGERFAGRVIDLSGPTLVIDEYGSEYDRRFSRTYLKAENITRIFLSFNWLKTIARSLRDKNI